ncbi:MAG: SCO family protein [Verrucomicrobia bacterium]|nr:SCO family protein [Verrucomicrobiota bacterium]|tara:strand:+ start:455 stop:1120 length:666 start_codon:yes stop_codon:yes gene_type:complete
MRIQNKLAIIIPALILVIGIAIAYKLIIDDQELPIFSPSQINPELVDPSLQFERGQHTIDDFELIDQNNNSFSQKNLKDKIYVADFFFTTCPTICPDMSGQLKRVQDAYSDQDDFMILSHTVQPEVDSPKVLKAYADLYEANTDQWVFVTGKKATIYDLARKSYFAAVTEGDGGPDDFIHTENFVLIDKEKRIRGFYDGTSEESVGQLIADISILANSYDQ